jgi:hypothetical protein
MVTWAFSCVKSILRSEMQTVAHHLKAPITTFSRDDLLKIDFHEIMEVFKCKAPNLWSTMRSVAWTNKQDARNTMKSPDWVCREDSL